jgi:catechol 2,3-dioxygenase-like lactoylglutathione lyase family enzyme
MTRLEERVISDAKVAIVGMKLEVVVIPVSDVDRAKEFYGRLGWRLDADFAFDNGSECVGAATQLVSAPSNGRRATSRISLNSREHAAATHRRSSVATSGSLQASAPLSRPRTEPPRSASRPELYQKRKARPGPARAYRTRLLAHQVRRYRR